MNETQKANLEQIEAWALDVFKFTDECLNMRPSEPVDELRAKPITYTNPYGEQRTTILFDENGRLVYHDLSFYTKDMFKHQGKAFNRYKGTRFTWQQTVELEAYNRAVQTFDQDSYQEATRWLTIRSGHGTGKQIDKKQKILCYNHKGTLVSREAQDIQVGDYILGKDAPTKVVGVYPQEKQTAYRVTFDDGANVVVGNPHLWAVRGRNSRRTGTYDWEVLTTEEILERGVKRKNGVSMARQWEIPQQSVQGSYPYPYAYAVGVWYGDGTCGASAYTKSDAEMREKVRESGFSVRKIGHKHNQVYGLITELKRVGADTANKNHLPVGFLDWDINSRWELLRGLCDTDGTTEKSGNVEFGTVREGLADDVVLLIRSLGGKARVRVKAAPKFTYNGEQKIGQKYYRVSFQTPENPFSLPRKAAQWQRPQDRYLARWIESIEQVEDMEGVCFKVDAEDELFLVGRELIVTHNTSFLSVVSLHFLLCFFGSQIGATANTEDQLKDIFLKELYFWQKKLPDFLAENLQIMDDMVRIRGERDWFLRARVARPEKPEALAGLHGEYVLLIADEASGIGDMVFEVMKGAITGKNYVVIYTGNPTRTEGEFYESHKGGSMYTKLKFDSRDSPIVEEGFVERITEDYGEDSDEFKYRVAGEFANIGEMDEKGWIPLFANINVLFEEDRGQIINGAVMGVDPAGQGKDRAMVGVRDNVYLKEVLSERVSSSPDLARKVETVRDAYNCTDEDIGIDAFGIGAEVVSNVQTKLGSTVKALLLDKPREGTEHEFASYRAELAWAFRTWARAGGIIVTNHQREWLRELSKIKYKRDGRGRIMLMPKEMFKKEYGFSPDKFDMACYTFHRENPTKSPVKTKVERENEEMRDFMRKAQPQSTDDYQSMSSM